MSVAVPSIFPNLSIESLSHTSHKQLFTELRLIKVDSLVSFNSAPGRFANLFNRLPTIVRLQFVVV